MDLRIALPALVVTLSNANTKSRKKNKKTFDVTLPSVEFTRLVMKSWRNFIQNVGPIGARYLLAQMLEYICSFLNLHSM